MATPDPFISGPDTIKAVTAWGHASLAGLVDNPGLDAELLLAFAIGASRSRLLAWPEQLVDPAPNARYRDLVRRRAKGEPLAYITGRREFWSLDLEVSADTLIPRPETERLVERALELLPLRSTGPVVDLGTGSGAVALALAAERPDLDIIAVDNSPAALEIGRRNSRRLGLEITFLESDWLNALQGRRFPLVVANPPYIPSNDAHLGASNIRFEPRAALDGGADGLTALATIIASAAAHLTADGVLLLEHGFDQGPAVLDLLAHGGYRHCLDHRDLAGRDRVAEGGCPDQAKES